jgi:hypothetical protein
MAKVGVPPFKIHACQQRKDQEKCPKDTRNWNLTNCIGATNDKQVKIKCPSNYGSSFRITGLVFNSV